MIVVSNTTPFLALACIGRLSLFERVFQTVHVAESVAEECRADGRIPVPDLRKLSWVIVHAVRNSEQPRLWMLDSGERDTLELSLVLKADWTVIDERIGRNVAEFLGIQVTGTLGVLLQAKRAGLIASFRAEADAMRAEGIHYHRGLIEKLARAVGE